MFNIDSISTYEKHWTALLDDPAMHADYLAFLEEQGLPLLGQTNSIASASEN